MHVPAICLLTLMICIQCSQAIEWHFAGAYGLICRASWRAPLSCRPWPDSGTLLAIGRYLESGVLIELLPDFQQKPLDVALVVAHRRNLSRRVCAFMKWIENVLAPYLE